jgi:hypothetical protein
MIRHFSYFYDTIAWKDRLLAAALAVICCMAFSASLSAQGAEVDDELAAVREHGQNPTGLRRADCLIKVQGVEYLHGYCSFNPSDQKDGFHDIRNCP